MVSFGVNGETTHSIPPCFATRPDQEARAKRFGAMADDDEGRDFSSDGRWRYRFSAMESRIIQVFARYLQHHHDIIQVFAWYLLIIKMTWCNILELFVEQVKDIWNDQPAFELLEKILENYGKRHIWTSWWFFYVSIVFPWTQPMPGMGCLMLIKSPL